MISIIAAIGKNRELGAKNKLLWRIPADMERFKELTTSKVVIMGRKTYESLPKKFRPLPHRVNIVITKNIAFHQAQGDNNTRLLFTPSIEEAIKKAKEIDKGEIFLIGGASIYKQGIKYADKLYLTLIDKEYPASDAFFPDYTLLFQKKIFEEKRILGNLRFKFIELVK